MDEYVIKQKIQMACIEPRAPEELIQQVILRAKAVAMGVAAHKQLESAPAGDVAGLASRVLIGQLASVSELPKDVQPEQLGTTRPDGSVSFSVSSGVYVIAKVSERGTMPPVLLILPEDQLETYIMISPKFSDSDEPGKPGDDDPDDDDKPKNPGDDDPDDKEPGDKEPGDKEPGGKEPGDKEPGNKEPGDKGPVESAKTGDSANVWLWSAVLAVALVGIAVVVKKNHGRR